MYFLTNTAELELSMTNKEKYFEFCTSECSLPLFFQPWWLDAVCKTGQWDVLIYEKNKTILGVYPYFIKRKYKIFETITMPKFTPFLGPYIKYPVEFTNSERAGLEKEIYTTFINTLPEFDYFIQLFNYDFTNWLPFLWKNFKQTTFYSYIIDDISDVEKVKSGFHYSKIKQINKAVRTLEVKFDLSSEEFYSFHKETLRKQNKNILYDETLFKGVVEAAYSNCAGKIIYASHENHIFAALFFVWDKKSGYNLISAHDPDHNNSGALDMLVMNAMAFLSDKSKKYDMEGSIVESYEFSFRHFGGRQQPYYQIKKASSPIIKLWEYFTY